MSFGVKRDKTFMTIILFSILIVMAVFLIPVIFSYESRSFFDLILSFFLLFITVGIIIWATFYIKYELRNDYLYIRGGVFRSRIRYEAITQVESLTLTIGGLLAGYRILSSKDGIIITYKTGFGVVKISPKDKSLFLAELKKRCSNAIFKKS
ncbi:PH domain-containing protein [Virgibacillus flavescens]|uniref:PH domain-containing protein n=1 Tax=Virgibacillus flavescens TaxID=1611422 RepID=UPI003D3390A1